MMGVVRKVREHGNTIVLLVKGLRASGP